MRFYLSSNAWPKDRASERLIAILETTHVI